MRRVLSLILLCSPSLMSCEAKANQWQEGDLLLVGTAELDRQPVGLGVLLDTIAGHGALYSAPEIYRICDLMRVGEGEWSWSTEEVSRRSYSYAGSLSDGELVFHRSEGRLYGSIEWETAGEAEDDPLVGQVFSKIYNSPRTGDLMGMELVLVPSIVDGYVALVEIPEGSLGAPELMNVQRADSGAVIMETRFGETYDFVPTSTGLAIGSAPSWLAGDTLTRRGSLKGTLRESAAGCTSRRG